MGAEVLRVFYIYGKETSISVFEMMNGLNSLYGRVTTEWHYIYDIGR